VKLEGRTAYGAPIQEIAMAARMYSIDEFIEFEPKPDGQYTVIGQLEEGKTVIWLRDSATGEAIGKKVERK
jgi:hypothetical protein